MTFVLRFLEHCVVRRSGMRSWRDRGLMSSWSVRIGGRAVMIETITGQFTAYDMIGSKREVYTDHLGCCLQTSSCCVVREPWWWG